MKKASAAKIRRVQFTTVFINILVLATVKYLNFFIGKFNDAFNLFEWNSNEPFINILVPLGLSYYTFNSIGYLIDVGRGKLKAEKHFGKFALFVSFFPSIVQGPLFRYSDVGVQLQQEHKFDYDQAKFGAQLILWGFFKKLVIQLHRCRNSLFCNRLLLLYLLRLLRRYRYYKRCCSDARHRASRKLQPALLLKLNGRLLAQMAYVTRCMDERICFLSHYAL